MQPRHTIIAIVFAVFSSSAAYAQTTIQEKTILLEAGMPQDEVIEIFGYPNGGTSLKTCGGAPGVKQWSCLVWKYESESKLSGLTRPALRVYFYKQRIYFLSKHEPRREWEWLVDHWNTY